MKFLILLGLSLIGSLVFLGARAGHIARSKKDSRSAQQIPEHYREQNKLNTAMDHSDSADNAHHYLEQQPNTEQADYSTDDSSVGTAPASATSANATTEADIVTHPDTNVNQTATSYANGSQAAVGDATENHANTGSNHTVENNNPAISDYSNAGVAATDNNVADTLDRTIETDNIGNSLNGSGTKTPTIIAEQNHTQQVDAKKYDGQQYDYVQSSNDDTHTQPVSNHASSASANHSSSNINKTNIASAGVAGVAAVTAASSFSSRSNVQGQSADSHAKNHDSTLTSRNQDLDFELGDIEPDSSTNEEHDEMLDFGDMTSDISDMLKELNLRESDSPRLDINNEEYAQLKTGEPGEVEQKKIEDVANKLRDMLR